MISTSPPTAEGPALGRCAVLAGFHAHARQLEWLPFRRHPSRAPELVLLDHRDG
jgi:hypothetical protein